MAVLTLSDIEKASASDLLSAQYNGNTGDLLDDLDYGLNQLLRTDLKSAGVYVTVALKLRSKLSRKFRPRFECMEARLAQWQGDSRTALRKYNRALKKYAGDRDYEAAARLRKVLIEVYLYAGMYQEAINEGRKALRYYRGQGQDINAARTMTNMGNVYHRMDRNHQALSYYDKARQIFEQSGGVGLAIVDFNRANIMMNLNRFGEARNLYRQAADFYHQSGMEIAEHQAEYSLAYLSFLEGQYTQALEGLERTRRAFERLGDRRSMISVMVDQSEVHLKLNQLASCIVLAEEVLTSINGSGFTYVEAKANYFLGMARMKQQDRALASTHLGAAERLFAKESNDLWLGMVKQARARLLLERGQTKKALLAAKQAAELFETGKDLRRQLDAQITQLEILYNSGAEEKAGRISQALKEAVLTAQQRFDSHCVFGDYLYNQRVWGKALAHFQTAARLLESIINDLRQDDVRFFYAAQHLGSCVRAAECLLNLGKVDQALQTHMSSMILLNDQLDSRSGVESAIPPDISEQIRQLRTLLNQLAVGPRDSVRGGSAVQSTVSVERRLRHLRRKACIHRQGIQPERSRAVWNLRGESGTVVTFFEGHHTAGAFVSSNGKTRFVRFELPPPVLRSLIRQIRTLASGAGGVRLSKRRLASVDRVLNRLYTYIIAPLEKYLNDKKIVLLVGGSFTQIPFAALVDHSGWRLKDLYRMNLIVNPEDLRREESGGRGFAGRKNAVFAVPNKNLPMVEEEGQTVASIFGSSNYYSGSKACIEEFVEELRQADGFVHLATHAINGDGNPLFSKLMFSDGPFYPFDLFDTGIKAELVTLSGCHTAANGCEATDDLSLARAFYRAGSRYVLATLWEVSDETALSFMTAFYTALSFRETIDEAFTLAMNEVETQNDNPLSWGAFVMLGR